MKISNFKKAFIGVVVAIFCSIMIITGITWATTNPTLTPNDATYVAPTFGSVHVVNDGFIGTTGVLSVDGDLMLTSKMDPGTGTDKGGFVYLSNNPTDPGASVVLIGSDVPNKNITLTTGAGGKIFLNDPVEALKLGVLQGIYAGSEVVGDAFHLALLDDVDVSGDVTIAAGKKLSTPKLEVTATDGISNPSNKLFLNDDVNVSGILYTDKIKPVNILTGLQLEGGYGSTFSSFNSNVSGLLYANDITATGDVEIPNGDLTVSQGAYIGGISGNNFEVKTATCAAPTGALTPCEVQCSAGFNAISCGYNANSIVSVTMYPISLYVDWSNRKCKSQIRNESGVSKNFTISAVCLAY